MNMKELLATLMTDSLPAGSLAGCGVSRTQDTPDSAPSQDTAAPWKSAPRSPWAPPPKGGNNQKQREGHF